jgi:hypothetical protein
LPKAELLKPVRNLLHRGPPVGATRRAMNRKYNLARADRPYGLSG